MEAEIVRVSREHPTLGYMKVTAKLRSLGYRANKKMIQRGRGAVRIPLCQPCRGLRLLEGLAN